MRTNSQQNILYSRPEFMSMDGRYAEDVGNIFPAMSMDGRYAENVGNTFPAIPTTLPAPDAFVGLKPDLQL